MAQMFKKKPIDGNSIVANIQKRRQQPGQFGRIHNLTTGETVTRQSPNAPEMEPSTYNQEYSKIPAPQERDTSSDNDLMEADEDFRNYSQAYEYETGIRPSYEEYEADKEANQEYQLTPEQLEEGQQEYLYAMGRISNLLEERGISLDEISQRIPEELEEVMPMVKDPRTIETYDDLVGVSMVIENIVEQLGMDSEEYWNSGEIVPKANTEESEESYEQRLARLDQQ